MPKKKNRIGEDMLRSIVISPDRELSERLQSALENSSLVRIIRKLDYYPEGVDLVRCLRSDIPQVIFLSVESRQPAIDLFQTIARHAPGTQFIAINRSCEPSTLLETMRAGIREFLSVPFENNAVQQALVRTKNAWEENSPASPTTGSIFAFLPSKPGVGTSTIALNASTALSRAPSTKVLLADFDFSCGMIGFMLKVQSDYSTLTAVENAMNMDENLWPKIVSSVGNMHVLPAGKLNPNARIEAAQITHLLEFARRTYKAICIDLSGTLDEFAIEILHEAKRVFLVCTAELPSLHLALRKIEILRSLDLEGRTTVLLNRAEKKPDPSIARVEKALGLPVEMTFSNDYNGVQKALTSGKHVDLSSSLGKSCQNLAETLMSGRACEKSRGFLHSLASLRDSACLTPNYSRSSP